jgi:hypothetical protein
VCRLGRNRFTAASAPHGATDLTQTPRAIADGRGVAAARFAAIKADSIERIGRVDVSIEAVAARQAVTPRSIQFEQDVTLLDHVIGAGKERGWHIETHRLGGLEIDNKLKLDGLLNWQVRRFGTLQYPVRVSSSTPE